MPDSIITLKSIKLLSFSYISAVILIICLLLFKQFLFFTLFQDQVASTQEIIFMNDQETRAERMFYNILELQNPDPRANFLPFVSSVKQDNAQWIITQNALYTSSVLSSSSKETLLVEKPEFQQMENSIQHILLLEQQRKKNESNIEIATIVRPDAALFFSKEQHYISTLIAARDALITFSSMHLTYMQYVEIFILCSILLVLLCEAFFITRPAILHLKNHMLLLKHSFDLLNTLQEKEQHE